MKRIAFLVTFFAFSLMVQGQKRFYTNNPNAYQNSILVEGYAGKILPHNSRFTINITEPTFSTELGYQFNSWGKKDWQRKWKYPVLGISFFYSHHGNNDILGDGYGILPHIQFSLFRTKYIDMYFRMGFGMSYLTKKYDRVHNPENIAIGSHFNNLTQFKIGFDWKLNRHVFLTTAFSLTHNSNAKFQNPNLGINLLAGSVGFRVFPTQTERVYNTEKPAKAKIKNEVSVRYSIGFHQIGTLANGPKFPIHTATIYYSRYTSIANKISAGVSASYDAGDYQFYRLGEIYPDENQKWYATNFNMFVGNEMYFGKLSFFSWLGLYLYKPSRDLPPIYVKLGLNYNVASFGKNNRHKIQLGVNLKTHFFVANYAEMGIGYSF